MEEVTDILCDFAFALKYRNFSDETIDQTKKFITDYYAASLAGVCVNKTFNSAVLNVLRFIGGNPQASVLFEKKKYSVSEAAFINAVYAHGADLDDGNRLSAGHIGTHVISAVFAVAEAYELMWEDVLTAIIVGYEFFNRLGSAAQPDLYNKGFHSTGVVGAIASGAACAKALGLSKEGIYNTVSLAAVQASGLIIIDESGQGCKPINPANAARIGIISALLGQQEICAPRNPLESIKGWFHAFSNEIKENYIVDGLGKKFTINESYLKLYPTCRHTHCCIDAAKKIRENILKDQKLIEDIIKIQIFIYPSAIKSAGKIDYPENSEEAKFSIKYATAVGLIKGKFDIEDLSLDSKLEIVAYLIEHMNLQEDCSMENREKGIRGARVIAFLSDGANYEKAILVPEGEGGKALSWEQLEKKMINCGKMYDNKKQLKRLFESCKNIEKSQKFIYPATMLTE